MKDPKRRVLQEFIKLFADEKSSSSSSTVKNSDDKKKEGRILLDEKTIEWANNGDGYKGVFMNILSYLDEFDLALSIQPTCKLFVHFSKSEKLWENIIKQKEEFRYVNGRKDVSLEEFKKQYEKIKNPKERFIVAWRDVYEACRDGYGPYVFHEPTAYSKRIKKHMDCHTCSDGIQEDEPFLVMYPAPGANRAVHLYCVDKEHFRERIPHVLTLVPADSPYKQVLIDSLYKSRMFTDGKKVSEYVEEDEDEEEDDKLPEFSCDICEEPIYGIRYNCLDCGEYDLCGYCCEKVLMKQKGSTLKMCQEANHPHEHTFQSIGEDFDTFSCNKCKDKIRGYRYHKKDESDYDLCALCFFDSESKEDFEKIDQFGHRPIEAIYTLFCEKLLLKEIKSVLEALGEETVGSKKKLSANLIEILKEKKESNSRPNISELVSNVERFCCKDENGNILPKNAPNSLVEDLDLVEEVAVKPPKKKTKLNEEETETNLLENES